MAASSSRSSSSSGDEWEDVDGGELTTVLSPFQGDEEDIKSPKGVEIVLSNEGGHGRKCKHTALERAVAAFNKELRHNVHKTHLLCLLAHCMQLNGQCDGSLLQAIFLSILPPDLAVGCSGSLQSEGSLRKLMKWFLACKDQIFAAVDSTHSGDSLPQCPSGTIKLSSTQALVALLRAIGFSVRLILALDPVPFKSIPKQRTSMSKAPQKDIVSPETPLKSLALSPTGGGEGSSATFLRLMQECGSVDQPSREVGEVREAGEVRDEEEVKVEEGVYEEKLQRTVGNLQSGIRGKKHRATALPCDKQKRAKRNFTSSSNESATSPSSALNPSPSDSNKATSSLACFRATRKATQHKRQQQQSTTMSITSPYFNQGGELRGEEYEENDCSSNSSESDDFTAVRRKATLQRVKKGKGRDGNWKENTRQRGLRGRKRSSQNVGRKREAVEGKKITKVRDSSPVEELVEGRKESTSHASQEGEKGRPKELYDESTSWAEVYVGEKRRWLCLHLPSCSVDQPKLCEKHCPHKLTYVIGISSGGREICDVTARYASDWCTGTRRLRLSGDWWASTVDPYAPSKEQREEEEEDLLTILYSHPLPTSINDYKSHPLYALRRHLLKFEALYPEDSQILGYCKGEAVYSRSCVTNLHTRETWLKEGRVVKRGEELYKTVKARPKKGQSVLEKQANTVKVFGRWQTEVYVPPPVVDGIVPRNEYGNVELFQPSMLPDGACQIKVSGIQKVARKLGIDCAPAMMGWDFHSGYCHPVIEGIVVAKENEEVLLEAWRQEEQLLIEKNIKKRETRVLQRWRKVVRRALIRERVKRAYSLSS